MDFENHSSLMKYIKGFYEFDEYLNEINSKVSEDFDFHHGYLINYEIIDKILNKINYENNKIFVANDITLQTLKDRKKYFAIEEIELRNSYYLLNMLFNGNKYILINRKLWKLLCKENEEEKEPIKYEINYSKIKFKLDDKIELIFSNYKNQKNIINLDFFYRNYNPNCDKYEKNFSIIQNIFSKAFEFNQYQKKFTTRLKVKDKKYYKIGYLTDINWFNKWDKYNDYSNLKNNYFDKVSEKEILNHIIYIYQLNKENIISLPPPKILKFQDKNELSEYLSKGTLIMINSALISSQNDINNKKSVYYPYDNKIEFYFGQNNSLIIEVNDNIISKEKKNNNNNNNNVNYSNLMQISKIFYYRKFLKAEIVKESNIQMKNYLFILIKKEIIDNYLSNFNFEFISKFLDELFIDYNNLNEKFDTLIKTLKKQDNNFFNELVQKEKSFSQIFYKTVKNDFSPTYYILNNTKLTCISDFEIIDESIYTFFIKNKIIQDDNTIKGEYIACDGKIFLSYSYNEKNIFEIGSIDDNGNFIHEYLIDGIFSLKTQIVEKFCNFGIKFILSNIKNDKFLFNNHTFFYCYKIPIENLPQDSKGLSDNKYNVINIVSSLMNLYTFEKELKKKLELSNKKESNYSTPFSTISYYLVNMNFISEIKKLFDYQQIKEFIDSNQINFCSQINVDLIKNFLNSKKQYLNYLKLKKDEFLKSKQKGKEFIEIEKKRFQDKKVTFNYPINCHIIEKNILNKFLDILDLYESQLLKKPEEVLVSYNAGKIVLIDSKENSKLYIYSYFDNIEKYDVYYFPEVIIDFHTFQNLNNHFQSLIRENILNQILIGKTQYICSMYECDVYLINSPNNGESNIDDINISDLNTKDKDEEFKRILSLSFQFTNEYSNFYDFLKTYKIQNIEQKIYLINKNYIDEIKTISNFIEISKILKENKEKNETFKNGNFNYSALLKESLKNETLNSLYNLSMEKIEQKLQNKNLFDKAAKYYYAQNSDLYYYENFQIIDKKLFDILNYYDSNLAEKCIKANAVFSSNKIVLLLNNNEKYVINVGQININDVLELDYLIQEESSLTKNYFDLKNMFYFIKNKGYISFKNYIKRDKIIIPKENSYSIQAKIYRLLNGKDDINIKNNYVISDKLKAIILLSIDQNKDIDEFHKSCKAISEKVYLMNYNFLMQYKYNEVFSLINENNEIKELVKQINESKYPYDSTIFDQIISKLENNEKLMEIDEFLEKTDLRQCNWEAKPEIIKLKDQTIKAYKEFILVKDQIFSKIQIKLSLSPSKKEGKYQ